MCKIKYQRDYQGALHINSVIVTSHMDGVCNIIITLPETSDYNVHNIVNFRRVLSVIGHKVHLQPPQMLRIFLFLYLSKNLRL